MKRFFPFILIAIAIPTPVALAAEWVNITTNAVGDKFLVDTNSINRQGETVWFWEFREFPQANNAFLEEKVNQPVHGVNIYWSADCTSKVQRMRRLTAYNKGKQVIQRFTYEDEGSLFQAQADSSAAKVLDYVCQQKGVGKREAGESGETESRKSHTGNQ